MARVPYGKNTPGTSGYGEQKNIDPKSAPNWGAEKVERGYTPGPHQPRTPAGKAPSGPGKAGG